MATTSENAAAVTTEAASKNTVTPGDEAPHLLVVDDDRRIRTLLSRYLTENGYRITIAENAASARDKLRGLAFDLIILDVMMPGESGLDLAKSLREVDDVPILMLTARAELEHRIAGLEAGVDDYLGKPFEPRELLLRVAAILRRGQPEILQTDMLQFGPFCFDMERRELLRGSDVVKLTDREKEFLAVFAKAPNETVSRLDLAGEEVSERAVDVQINRLRRKIEKDPGNPLILQTVRGIGYRLNVG
ncbi:MAG: response regulator transcription factor [Tepidamorphaceae bacterium]|nr:response regulator transcription factor [Rhodobiaceae bacterium]MCC0049617.1 response regulator transcription factor [Rhodobiaceae bacterium]